MSRNTFDDDRDDVLADALRDAVPEPPLDKVDWSHLQARIAAAAQPHFAPAQPRSSAGAPWWQPLAGWSHRGIPLAAAATVLLMLGAGALGTRSAAVTGAASFHTVEEELAYGVSTGTRTLLMDMESDAMLDLALFHDREDW